MLVHAGHSGLISAPCRADARGLRAALADDRMADENLVRKDLADGEKAYFIAIRKDAFIRRRRMAGIENQFAKLAN